MTPLTGAAYARYQDAELGEFAGRAISNIVYDDEGVVWGFRCRICAIEYYLMEGDMCDTCRPVPNAAGSNP